MRSNTKQEDKETLIIAKVKTLIFYIWTLCSLFQKDKVWFRNFEILLMI